MKSFFIYLAIIFAIAFVGFSQISYGDFSHDEFANPSSKDRSFQIINDKLTTAGSTSRIIVELEFGQVADSTSSYATINDPNNQAAVGKVHAL